MAFGPEMHRDAERRTLIYRPVRYRVNSAAIALMSCALAGFILFDVCGSWRLAAVGLAVAAGVWTVRRAVRISLIVTAAGVTVNNYWKTYEFAWSEVSGVGIGLKRQGVSFGPALAFSLRLGAPVFAQATPLRQAARGAFLDAVVALAPSSVERLPDRVGSMIGSDNAPSESFRRWLSRREF
jgi:hypothetical protein